MTPRTPTRPPSKPRPPRPPRRSRAALSGSTPDPAQLAPIASTRAERVGRVTRFWARSNAAAVTLDLGLLRAGERVQVRGATTDVCFVLERIEREGSSVAAARRGDTVTIAVPERVRVGDLVHRLRARRRVAKSS